ncbi:hypothetical protein ACHAXH_002653 [Discostella pseudostelligera]
MTQDCGNDIEKAAVVADSDDKPDAALVGSSSNPPTTHGSGGDADAGAGSGVGDSGSGNPNRVPMQRKLSISEQASSLSSRRFTAPSYLKWIEYPFRIQNITTECYIEEATAQCMDVAARGPINQTGSFVGSVMLSLAAAKAGGPTNKIYGIQASSYLTVASLIVGLTSAVTLPFIGAFVDHTDHRKVMGAVSAFFVVISVGVQISIGPNTWFLAFIFEIVGGYFLVMHQVCCMAYLPDLTHDIAAVGHYTSRLMISQYLSQGIFTSIVIIAGFAGKISSLQSAKLAAALSFSIGSVLFGYAWIFLYRKRPKLREVPPGSNLLTTGFKQLLLTTKVVFQQYRALKWFMLALLFSPEAGSGALLSIAVTFLTFFVKMEVKEIALVSIIVLFSNIPGALLAKKMCRLINPLNSYRCAQFMFAAENALLAGIVTGSTRKDKILVYVFSAFWGFSFGWMFPSQRTLAVALIPKGQETEMMGLISFFMHVLGWLPVFIFTALNENGVNMRWGVASVSFLLLLSVTVSFMCGSFQDAVDAVAHTSDNYLSEYAKNVGEKESSTKRMAQSTLEDGTDMKQ